MYIPVHQYDKLRVIQVICSAS